MLADDALRPLLENARRIAVVGANDSPGRPVDRVGRYLLEQGYMVYPVHPVRRVVWGLTAYPCLGDIPEPVDIINIFRAPQYCPDHAREALALPQAPKLFWMQSGISSPEARDMLVPAGIMVIEDSCLMVDHARLLGVAISPRGLA